MNLGDTIDQAIRVAVQEALVRERPLLVEQLREQLAAEAMEPAWLTPSQVRMMARCSSARVFQALASGDLLAECDEDPTRAREGIPGRRWRIKPKDARKWAAQRGQA